MPAHLLGHDQRFLKPEARAAMFFRNVQPQQAEAAEFGPEGGQPVRLGFQQATGRSAGLMIGQEAGDGLREGAVLFRDGDRHGQIFTLYPVPVPAYPLPAYPVPVPAMSQSVRLR